MSSFEIKSARGGVSDYEDKGIEGAFKLGKAIDIRKVVDSISCQQALVEEPSVGAFNGLPIAAINSADGNTYFFCQGGRIIQRAPNGTYTLKYTETNESGNIKGAWEWPVSTGKRYMFWATDTRLNLKEIPGNATWSVDVNALATWPKTNLTSSAWHVMREAVGNLVIGNESTLAFVGYDASYTNNALQLIPGNVVKTVIERGLYVVIGAARKDIAEKSMMFIWDGQSQNWNDKKYVPIGNLNAIVDTEVPLMQVGSNGQIFYGDLQNILPITSIPGGGQCYPYGVENDNGLALFGIFGNTLGYNGIWSYGRKKKNAPFALNFEYPLTCDEIGCIVKAGTDILIGYRNGSTYGVKKVDTTTKAQGIYQSLDLKAPARFQKPAKWEKAVFQLAALPSGCSLELWRRVDKVQTGGDGSGWYQCNLEGGALSFNTTGAKEAVFYIGDLAKIFEYKLVLNPSGNTCPEVLKGEIYFD